MARSSDRVRCEGEEKIGMTKLQEFILSISNQKDEMSGLPAMTADEKRVIDNLKKAVEEAIKVFSKYE